MIPGINPPLRISLAYLRIKLIEGDCEEDRIILSSAIHDVMPSLAVRSLQLGYPLRCLHFIHQILPPSSVLISPDMYRPNAA